MNAESNKSETTVSSPLTGDDDVTLLATIPAQKLIEEWRRSYHIEIEDQLHGHQKLYMYRCNASKLKFFYPFDVAGTSALYESLQEFDWFYLSAKWEYEMALKDLAGCKQALEIGCGFGHFLKVARESGLSLSGIEINEKAVRQARNNGLPVAQTEL